MGRFLYRETALSTDMEGMLHSNLEPLLVYVTQMIQDVGPLTQCTIHLFNNTEYYNVIVLASYLPTHLAVIFGCI